MLIAACGRPPRYNTQALAEARAQYHAHAGTAGRSYDHIRHQAYRHRAQGRAGYHLGVLLAVVTGSIGCRPWLFLFAVDGQRPEVRRVQAKITAPAAAVRR